jgi:hypothetical protein
MFFVRPADVDVSVSGVSAVSVAGPMGIFVCPPLFWPVGNQAEVCTAIYRVAYEQLMAALAPSKFQRAVEPSMN